MLAIPSSEGKISAEGVEAYLDTFYSDFKREHMVFPGMVYISHPTEYGTLYTKDELKSLAKVCKTRDSFIYGWRKTRLWFNEREYRCHNKRRRKLL